MALVVANPLVAHIWRIIAGSKIYQNWYEGRGAFVARHPDVQEFVRSYFHEQYPAVAMATLCSAAERLLRYAIEAEGRTPAGTLPSLLEYCVSSKQKYFNILGFCCDPRSIHHINSLRKGVEHGDHSEDRAALDRTGWHPTNPSEEYLKIIVNRLLSPHGMVCGLFNQVDPETGFFLKDWKPRGFAQCEHAKGAHDDKGRPIK